MLKKTIETLIEYNRWRRGGDGEMLNPADISVAINHAISVLMQVETLIEQRDIENQKVAFRGLRYWCGNDG